MNEYEYCVQQNKKNLKTFHDFGEHIKEYLFDHRVEPLEWEEFVNWVTFWMDIWFFLISKVLEVNSVKPLKTPPNNPAFKIPLIFMKPSFNASEFSPFKPLIKPESFISKVWSIFHLKQHLKPNKALPNL